MSRAASRRLAVALVIALGLAGAPGADRAQAPIPDGAAIGNARDVELCRPQGRCFIPENDDPIFAGDVIETLDEGRFAFGIASGARVVLLAGGRIRIDRDASQRIAIALMRGTLVVEAGSASPLDVTLGATRCVVDGRAVALTFHPGRAGSSVVSNGAGSVRCTPAQGSAREIDRGTAIDWRAGQTPSFRPIPEGFWSILETAR